MNSGHPVALSITVKTWIFSMVAFPGTEVILKRTSHGPTRSTCTSSQGVTLVLTGKGIEGECGPSHIRHEGPGRSADSGLLTSDCKAG